MDVEIASLEADVKEMFIKLPYGHCETRNQLGRRQDALWALSMRDSSG